MCHTLFYIVTVALILLECQALNCRTEGGPKENELKSVYMTCLKKQEGKNSSDAHAYTDDSDWKDQRQSKFNQKKTWNKNGMRDMDDPMRDRNDRDDTDDRMRSRDDRMGSRDDRMGSRDDRMGSRDDRMGSRDDRIESRDGKMGSRDDRNSRGDRMGHRENNMNRNNMMDKTNDGFGQEYNGRFDYPHSAEFDGDMSRYNNGYFSTTQPTRRFKRSKRGQNSGQRSQYNPNSKKTSEYDETYKDDDRNSSNSSMDVDSKACALHCFMEQLEMTGDDGMPDKYLVTHAITKDVKNEDLRDFLQESIEECFQMLVNENSEEKCEFSRNLMMCLSEKGRANCDDWKDDLKF